MQHLIKKQAQKDRIIVPTDVLGRRRKTIIVKVTRNTPAAPPHDVLGRATTSSGLTYEMRLDHGRSGDPYRYEERAYHGRPAKRLCPECRCTGAHQSGCSRPDGIQLSARLAPPPANASRSTWKRFAKVIHSATAAQLALLVREPSPPSRRKTSCQ